MAAGKAFEQASQHTQKYENTSNHCHKETVITLAPLTERGNTYQKGSVLLKIQRKRGTNQQSSLDEVWTAVHKEQ